MKGIDASYRYEGYATYSMEELDRQDLRVLLARVSSKPHT